MTSASSRARLVASDPPASPRTSSPVSSRVRRAASFSVCLICDHRRCFLFCFFSFSRLRGPGEQTVGMPTIPDGKCCISKEGERRSPCSAPCQTSRLSLSAVCVLKCRTVNHSMTPYLKENLPKRLHFAYNDRIERGHLYMKSGWQAAL